MIFKNIRLIIFSRDNLNLFKGVQIGLIFNPYYIPPCKKGTARMSEWDGNKGKRTRAYRD